MPIVSTARGNFHYKDYRKTDDAHPIVLIHGAGGMYLDWSITMRRELGVIALDLNGHGRSSGNGHKCIKDYAKDVVAFIDALELSNVILVGHSMGGAIAQQIALDFPHTVSRLILIATSASFVVNDLILSGLLDNTEAAAELIINLSWSKNTDADIKRQGLKRLLQTPADIIHGDYLACHTFDVRDRLEEVQIPTLVIAGAKDKMTPLEWNKTLADNMPNRELHIFDDYGHMLHVENVEEVTRLMLDWIGASQLK